MRELSVYNFTPIEKGRYDRRAAQFGDGDFLGVSPKLEYSSTSLAHHYIKI